MCARSTPTQLTPDEVRVIPSDGDLGEVLPCPDRATGDSRPAHGEGLRVVIDLVQAGPRSCMATTPEAAASRSPEGRDTGRRAGRGLAYGYFGRAPEQSDEGWLHALIDNFSRRILAWRVAERFEISNAVAILDEAVCNAVGREDRPTVMADGGIENFNSEVDALVGGGTSQPCPRSRGRAILELDDRKLVEQAQAPVSFLHRLETAAAVRHYVAFYVAEYNATIPHAAFSGQTPDEIYWRERGFRRSSRREEDAARAKRLKVHRAVWCGRCPGLSGSVAGVAA